MQIFACARLSPLMFDRCDLRESDIEHAGEDLDDYDNKIITIVKSTVTPAQMATYSKIEA